MNRIVVAIDDCESYWNKLLQIFGVKNLNMQLKIKNNNMSFNNERKILIAVISYSSKIKKRTKKFFLIPIPTKISSNRGEKASIIISIISNFIRNRRT